MGLFKTAARTAVATSVHGRVRRRQANRWAAEDQARAAAAAQQPPVAPVAPAPPTAPQPASAAPAFVPPAPAGLPVPPATASAPAEDVTTRRLAQLTQLGELRAAGVLTDAEFEAQKAAVLAG